MSLDAAQIRRQEQELLACAESLRVAKSRVQALKDGIRQAWQSAETDYVLAAVDKTLAELDKEIHFAEQLAKEISEKGARLRVEAALLEEASFLEGVGGLF